MEFKTTDLCDQFPDLIQVVTPIFRAYGGRRVFGGEIATIRVYEDNVLVRQMLETTGHGRVLVVDGGGSLGCALMGDQVVQLACNNGWAGLLVNGCIRDSLEVAQIDIGVSALNTLPRKSRKEGLGQCDCSVTFADATFQPGHFLYADEDGIILASQKLV